MHRLADLLKECIQLEYGIEVESFFSKRRFLHIGF